MGKLTDYEVLWRARNIIKVEIRNQGSNPSWFNPSDITAAAKELIKRNGIAWVVKKAKQYYHYEG